MRERGGSIGSSVVAAREGTTPEAADHSAEDIVELRDATGSPLAANGVEAQSRPRCAAAADDVRAPGPAESGDAPGVRRAAARSRVGFQVHRVSELKPAEWASIWALVECFFEVDPVYTGPMLRGHEYIVLFRAKGDPVLAGMSAFDVLPVEQGGRRVVAIYNSYVALREEYRGLNLLQESGFAIFLRVKWRHPLTPVVWFFDSFSVMSYLMLPRNFDVYWPRHDVPTPDWERVLMDRLGRIVNGSLWRPEHGVAHRSGRERLRPGVAPMPAPGERSAEAAFFAERNPGHAEGDVLVCLVPLSPANLWAFMRRAGRRAWRAMRWR